jgi:serine O-acetyltransferase
MKNNSLAHNLFLRKTNFQCLKTLERKSVQVFLNNALDLIFPGMFRKNFKDREELTINIQKHFGELEIFLKILLEEQSNIILILKNYAEQLPAFCDMVEKDATFLLEGDPAASSIEEVLLCYPGLYAVASYRLAHFFYQHHHKILARLMGEIAHEKTGIDIHPGAKIGAPFFIDHGTGVVIGETAEIGDHVKIYQGVTLGALSVDKALAQVKRHPTLEDGCVIYSHATILGGETIIGKESVIGGNVWITKSVPAHSLVFHKNEVRLERKKNYKSEDELNYSDYETK